jgi:DpnII restriction endonuclease
MARAKTSEQSRSRSKAATIEELTRGVEKLQEFLAQVEDLSREGFPYLDAGKARTELQFRECIRRTFGEKSPEFQEHRHHRLLMDSPKDTQQSITLIKTLIATLEQKKLDLQEGASPQQIPATTPVPPIPTRPQMTLVPASPPMVHMTMTQAAPVTPPPMIMSVAMTTNLDLSSATAAPSPSLPPLVPSDTLGETEPLSPSTSLPEPAPISPAPTSTAMSHTPPQPVARLAPAPLHRPPQTAQPAQAASSHASRPPQPPQHEPEPIMHPIPSATPEHQMQEAPPVPTHLHTRPSMQIGSSSHQEPAPQSPQAGSDSVERVKTLCCRFHSVARQLRLRGEYRATLSVEDEFDAQDLLHTLLRIQFDNIDTDEWTPSYSSGTPRTTLLLNDSRLAVIVKKTRSGLNAKDLTDQLRIDAERYRSHGRCTTLLCFIYDPEGRIGNPRGLEASLTSVNDSFVIDVLVAPK